MRCSRTAFFCAVLTVLTLGCGDPANVDAAAESQVQSSSTTSDQERPRSTPTTTFPDSNTTTTALRPTDGPTTTEPGLLLPSPTEPGLRLAPSNNITGGLYFDREGIRSSGHSSTLQRWEMEGPIAEYVDLYEAGQFMQRSTNDTTIWTAGNEPTKFVSAPPGSQLQLLGGSPEIGAELLAYQRHADGTSQLEVYDFQTQSTRTIAFTGDGNKRRTEFSVTSSDEALGRYVDGNEHGMVLLRLSEEAEVDAFAPAQAICRSDTHDLCPRYDHAAFHQDTQLILGARPIDEETYGFFWFDHLRGTEETLTSLPWSIQSWQVENLYWFVASIQDAGGRPLPALWLADGEPTTFATTGFPRQQQLS